MIDEKKLINYIKTEINPYGKPFLDTAYEFGLKLIDYIEAMEEQPQVGGWIPASERLPEDGYGVLVTVNGKHNNITFVDALEIAEYDGDFGWIVEGYPQWTDPDVTAWQPLPEPFEESDKE